MWMKLIQGEGRRERERVRLRGGQPNERVGGGRDGWRGSETDEGVNLGCGDILSLRLRVDGGEPPRR